MSSLDIKINIARLTDYSASIKRTVDKKTLLLMIESFSKYVMNLYGSLIEESINSRRYKGNWEPVDDEEYVNYLGVVPEGKIIYYIKDALECKKLGGNFVIRFDPKYRYPGSKLYLHKVLRAIDQGTSKFHSRPIFSKITRQIKLHILDLWRGFLQMKNFS